MSSAIRAALVVAVRRFALSFRLRPGRAIPPPIQLVADLCEIPPIPLVLDVGVGTDQQYSVPHPCPLGALLDLVVIPDLPGLVLCERGSHQLPFALRYSSA